MTYFVVFLTYKGEIDTNMFHLEHCFWLKLLNFADKK